eukprot:TRINITY_DN6058_c0_g3_i1.p1 TRINITY_DN6058_c0_g3~~TRINITY_DN6058_c0_g3_i1.p1  ORF type:complete len:805 (+),score=184.88 TRINITY_DN6058_c0_g3_i1:85-2499(+)
MNGQANDSEKGKTKTQDTSTSTAATNPNPIKKRYSNVISENNGNANNNNNNTVNINNDNATTNSKDTSATTTTTKKAKVAPQPNASGGLSLLNEIAESMTKTIEMKGKQPTINPSNNNIADNVVYYLMNLNNIPLEYCEIEVRIGLVVDQGAWRNGMHKEDFDRLMNATKNMTKKNPSPVVETDYFYPENQGNKRVTYDELQGKCVRAQRKTALFSENVSTQANHLVYDFRVSIAAEEPTEVPLELSSGYTMKREKVRTTFQLQSWRIEFTTVTTSKGDGNDDSSHEMHEIEFELNPSSIPNHRDPNVLKQFFNHFFDEVKKLISNVKASSVHSFPELTQMEKVVGDEADYLRSEVVQFSPVQQKINDTFIGSMPVGFSRKNIPIIQSLDYYVSEKTDGIRYLLYIVDAPYLIDRRFDFYQVQGYELLVDFFGTVDSKRESITLLDGEMVRNLDSNRLMFMVFDILVLRGNVVHHLNLEGRLGQINVVIREFRDALGNVPPENYPFELIGKNFVKKRDIGTIFDSIQTNKEGERVFRDKRRHHFTDGLIFTPNVPYIPFTAQGLYKWKYLDKLTVDFCLRFRKGELYLVCAGHEGKEVDLRAANFSPTDRASLERDLGRSRDRSSLVVECSFSSETGLWKYHGQRPDKNKPNFISIVMDTLEVAAENITTDELRYRIARVNANDDWEKQIANFKYKLSRMPVPANQKHPTHQNGPPPSSSSHNSHTHSKPPPTTEKLSSPTHQTTPQKSNINGLLNHSDHNNNNHKAHGNSALSLSNILNQSEQEYEYDEDGSDEDSEEEEEEE